MNETTKARISLISAMLIFGTIGIFRRYIPLSSGVIALVRGVVGTLFLTGVMALKRQKQDGTAIKKNVVPLLISGALIGFNWMLLFEAYNYTTVAKATLAYYMSPVFVVLASPFLLKERMTAKKLICMAVSVVGMLLVSGVFSPEKGKNDVIGVVLGLGAALLYASVVLINKKITNISAYDKTVVQLAAAAVVMVPYLIFTKGFSAMSLSPLGVVLLLVMGIVHTGMAYALYFGSFDRLPAQTVALFAYVDPVAAVILSALILKESMGPLEIVGAVLVLAAAVAGDLAWPKKKK